jgi:alpha-ketoglutarate-dependent taurine dioxygenase
VSAIRVEKIKPAIGGIVHVAKEDLLNDGVVSVLREALDDRGVLVFPRIDLTNVEQLALTDKIGKRLNYVSKAPGSGATGEADVYAITLDKKINYQPEYVLGTFFWHIDGVTIDQPLPKGTLLTARKLSSTGGQEWAAQPAFSYRHEWQEGDLVIWDNYGLMHRVVPYDVDSGRMMHRTTLKGGERVAA